MQIILKKKGLFPTPPVALLWDHDKSIEKQELLSLQLRIDVKYYLSSLLPEA